MKKTIFTILPMALLASCSSELMETTDNAVKGGDVEKVSIVSHPFVFDDDTRTSLTATENSISFAWADYDALGVFPIAPTTNNQARQVLSVPADCETDAHYASFDGAGWELKKGNTYAAYCPYNGSLPAETPYTEVPIDMTGQDGTLETIGKKYDYMFAPSSFAEVTKDDHKHEVVFDFQHAISIIQFKLTMPVAATWKSLTLTTPSGSFVTFSKMNVQDGTVTSTVELPYISLALNNVTTTANNKEITLYVAVLPKKIETLSLTATTSNNESYCASVTGKTLVAGKAYRFTTTFNTTPLPSGDGYENGYAYVDLGLSVKWATMNVGAANATEYGKYYAWGETKAYCEEDTSNETNYRFNSGNSYVKTKIGIDTYKWCNGSYKSYTKYCTDSEYGTVDNKTTLDPEDDAATQNWGGAWRMPTHEEQEELVNNCYWVWTSSYNGSGVAGYIVYAAKSPSDKGHVVYEGKTPSSDYSLSDSHIFLPGASYLNGSSISYSGGAGHCWSSSLDVGSSQAWYLAFIPSTHSAVIVGSLHYDVRYYSISVRAVCK